LVYADDVNALGGSVCTIEKNTEALVVSNKKIGLDVNADTTKYMVMSQDQNAGRSHSKKTEKRKSSNIWEQP
jgi:shikimate kinase